MPIAAIIIEKKANSHTHLQPSNTVFVLGTNLDKVIDMPYNLIQYYSKERETESWTLAIVALGLSETTLIQYSNIDVEALLV